MTFNRVMKDILHHDEDQATDLSRSDRANAGTEMQMKMADSISVRWSWRGSG